MARPRHALLATSFSLFVACNAILGNEDHYTLVPPDPVGDAGAAGASAAGAGGDSASGGDGTGGVAQGGAAQGGAAQGGAAGAPSSTGGAGGSGGSAGASGGGEAGAGAAGGAACVPTGAENCFNGVDDDCNGDLDCADPACADPAACVPAPAGATIATFPGGLAGMGNDCPAGYSPLTLRRGLSAAPTCTGCRCTPDAPRCESGIYGHGTYPCPSYQFSGLLYNSFSDRCQGFSGDQSVHFYAVRGFTTCTASGTATLAPASWSETRTVCAAERVGAGCAAGSVCAPRVTTSRCTIRRGTATCGGTYPTSTGETWYTGMTDGRSCPACSCAFGSATCTGAKIQLFASTDCSGSPVDLGAGAEGDVCAVPIVARSSRVAGTATNASCEPNTYPTGELAGADPRTVCCE